MGAINTNASVAGMSSGNRGAVAKGADLLPDFATADTTSFSSVLSEQQAAKGAREATKVAGDSGTAQQGVNEKRNTAGRSEQRPAGNNSTADDSDKAKASGTKVKDGVVEEHAEGPGDSNTSAVSDTEPAGAGDLSADKVVAGETGQQTGGELLVGRVLDGLVNNDTALNEAYGQVEPLPLDAVYGQVEPLALDAVYGQVEPLPFFQRQASAPSVEDVASGLTLEVENVPDGVLPEGDTDANLVEVTVAPALDYLWAGAQSSDVNKLVASTQPGAFANSGLMQGRGNLPVDSFSQAIDLPLSGTVDVTEGLQIQTQLTEKGGLAKWAQVVQETGDVGADVGDTDETTSAALAAIRLTQALPTGNTAARVSGGLSTVINVPVGQPQWNAAVSEKVMWMASQNLQEAEIHLDPPELGPMQVRVSVANEQAHVSFVVHHSAVRDALDQGAVRLREMFAEEGLDLGSVDVSDQSASQYGQSERDSDSPQSRGQDGSTDEEPAITAVTRVGGIDHYV